jgi:hypothetical protein
MAAMTKGSKAPYKKETQKDVTFAEGGDTPMFGHQQAGSQKSGGTAHKVDGSDQGGSDNRGIADSGEKYASGGSTKMFGYNPSVPATAGQTGAR